MIKQCGVMTENGPCTMRKDHEKFGGASYHRHRTYDALRWELFVLDVSTYENRRRLDAGEGVNQLTTAISKNRVSGTKLVIEINC
jgi:hypothetical protein